MIDLNAYGFPMQSIPADPKEGMPARIVAEHRGLFRAVCPQGEVGTRLRAAVYRRPDAPEIYPAVGDFVLLQYQPCGDSVIVKTLPRKSRFSRPDFFGRGPGHTETSLEQVAAANFDTVFIMASLNQDYNPRRIERYLAAAWESGGAPVVVLTKADLLPDWPGKVSETQSVAPGAAVYAVSAHTGLGLSQLAPYIGPGKTAVFLGSSGVGKSSLVNALAGEDAMPVNEVRESDGRGRHTTTHRQPIRLSSGGMVIDTPGMRELGLWRSDGLSDAFAEIERLAARCLFSDCAHMHEPGCAVREALENGRLDAARWKNYKSLQREARYSEDKAGYTRKRTQEYKKRNKQLRKSRCGNG